MKEKNVLVLAIDRDNDLGHKTGIAGPVIGRKENLKAAAKLALSDPSESDANCMFGAVKKFEELKTEFSNVEIATLTGHSKEGFESDKKINEQLDAVMEKFHAEAFVLVTDGGEDDQTIPILQSRAPIISKELIIVKQAKEVESIYFTIINALKEPSIKRIVFLIPGIIVLLYGVLFFLGSEKLFLQIISLVIGIYLILKGTGLEEIIAEGISTITNSISLQRVSFPFYLITIILLILGIYSSWFAYSTGEGTILMKATEIIKQILLFGALSALSFVLGVSVDSIHLKKAFYLRNYFLSATAIVILWFILDSARAVLVGEPQASLEWLVINIIISFALALIAYRISGILDLRKKITRLLIGLPVYSKKGEWLGRVTETHKENNSIKFNDTKSKKEITLEKGKFMLKGGRVLLVG
ncbi:MAG: DUF373 family protein [Candidatus Diapherotrites archaeon]